MKYWKYLLPASLLIAAFIVWKMLQPEATVQVVRPRIQTIRAYVEEQAVTELPRDYLISMSIDGWLKPIELREGDLVEENQVVAQLETDDLRDRVVQSEQRIAVLESQIAATKDHRLEKNALIEVEATVKAIGDTVKAAEAKLDASRALVDFTRRELDRVRTLSEASAVSEAELREAELQSRRARAELQSDSLELAALKTVEAVSYIGPKFINDYIDRKSFQLEQLNKELVEAKTQLEIEKRNLSRGELRAPLNGVVLQRHQTRRQFLLAGTPLLTIGCLDDMEITVEILTERAMRIEPDDPVEIFGGGLSSEPLQGRVLRVYPAGFKKISSLGVEQQRVKVAVKLTEPPQRLGVGFRVYVRIFYDLSQGALVIPRTCLFRDEQSHWNVMLVHDGVTEIRPVELGLSNDDLAEIIDGLSEKEYVITQPSREVLEGTRVEIRVENFVE